MEMKGGLEFPGDPLPPIPFFTPKMPDVCKGFAVWGSFLKDMNISRID
jgi:hypothetical protein